MRQTIIGLAVVSGCLMAACDARADFMLTGASVFSSDASGSFQSPNRWNTQPGDPWYNIYFTAPNTGMTGSFINSGNGAATSLSLSLTPGSYQFFLFADPGQASSFEALNLFFDGNMSPAISAFAPVSLSTTAPGFSANASPSTLALDGTNVVAGSGRLATTLDGYNVALTSYSWADPSVYQLDRVGPFATGGDGAKDFVGSITLTVTPASVPEPSTVVLIGIGLSAVAGAKLAARKRSHLLH